MSAYSALIAWMTYKKLLRDALVAEDSFHIFDFNTTVRPHVAMTPRPVRYVPNEQPTSPTQIPTRTPRDASARAHAASTS